MNKKILISIFVFLILISFVSAIPLNGENYYDFNGNALDLWGGNTGILGPGISNSTQFPVYNTSGDGSTGVYRFDGTTNAIVNIGVMDSIIKEDGDWSVSVWWNSSVAETSCSADIHMIFGWSTGGGIANRLLLLNGGYYFDMLDVSANAITLDDSAICRVDGQYHNVIITYDDNGASDTLIMYHDGIQIDTGSNNIGNINGGYDIKIGDLTGTASGDNFHGHMDEFKVFSKTLAIAEVQKIFNEGGLESISKFRITNTNSINIFNATVNGTFYSTTNGTINTALNNSGLIIPVIARAENWFDYNNNNVNLTNDLSINFIQSIINFSITNNVTGDQVSDWTLFNGSTILLNTTLGSEIVTNLVEGEYNDITLKSNSGVFLDKTLSGFNISALDNKTINFSILTANLNITVYDHNNNPVNNFTASITNLNNTHSLSSNTTNGEIIFDVIDLDIYEVVIDAEELSLFNNSANITINGLTKINFTLYTTNSIKFYFKYENNESLITENVAVEIIGNINSYNYTTSNSSLYVDLLSPDDYIVRSNALGFLENFYYFELNNRSYNEINIYLISNSTGQEVTCVVYDEVNNLVEDVYIKVLKYYSNSNHYKVVSYGKTNFEGEARINIEKGEEYYKFMLYYPLSILKEETNPTYIYPDTETLNFQINLGEVIANNYFNTFNSVYSLTFNNNTNNFRLVFSDTNGLSSQYCLYVYKLYSSSETLINYNCLESSAGTILINITPTNGSTYLSKAFVYYGSNKNFLDSLTAYFPIENNNPLWLFLVIILTMVFALSSVWNIKAALFLTPIPLFLTSIIGMIPLNPVIIGCIYIIFIIISFVIN